LEGFVLKGNPGPWMTERGGNWFQNRAQKNIGIMRKQMLEALLIPVLVFKPSTNIYVHIFKKS